MYLRQNPIQIKRKQQTASNHKASPDATIHQKQQSKTNATRQTHAPFYLPLFFFVAFDSLIFQHLCPQSGLISRLTHRSLFAGLLACYIRMSPILLTARVNFTTCVHVILAPIIYQFLLAFRSVGSASNQFYHFLYSTLLYVCLNLIIYIIVFHPVG